MDLQRAEDLRHNFGLSFLTQVGSMRRCQSELWRMVWPAARANRIELVKLFLAVILGVCATPVSALAAEGSTPIFDSEGTLHLPALTIPQSELISPQFKHAYVKLLRELPTFPATPAMNAPKAEWDKYDADNDRIIYLPPLKWKLAHYPVKIVDTHIAGVHVGIVTPKDGVSTENKNRVLINLHFGGFYAGRGLLAGLNEAVPIASVGRIEVITLDYREAPYYRFPAASEDVATVYRFLLRHYKPGRIGLYGCSTGGTLTAQSLAWFQYRGLPRPGAVGIFCEAPVPYGKRGLSAISGLVGIPGFGAQIGARRGPGYMADAKPDDPLAYPGSFASVLAKFPPTLFVVGGRAGDLSGAAWADAHLLNLGVDSYLYVMEAGWHAAYVIGGYDTPEGEDTVKYIADWFNEHLESDRIPVFGRKSRRNVPAIGRFSAIDDVTENTAGYTRLPLRAAAHFGVCDSSVSSRIGSPSKIRDEFPLREFSSRGPGEL